MYTARTVLGLTAALVLLPASALGASPSPAASVPGPAVSPPPAGGPSLDGRDWMLISYVAEDGGLAGATAPATIRFDGNDMSGNTGCNAFGSSYTSDGDSLRLGDIAVTEVACDPAIGAQEAAVLAALRDTDSYRLATGDLEMLDGSDNIRLTYRTLAGKTWVPLFSGGSPVPDAIVTLTFAGDEASGQGPCNAYSAPASVDGSALSIGAITSTAMECPDLAIEQAYFEVLAATRSWTIDTGDLVLLDGAAVELLRLAAASTGD